MWLQELQNETPLVQAERARDHWLVEGRFWCHVSLLSQINLSVEVGKDCVGGSQLLATTIQSRQAWRGQDILTSQCTRIQLCTHRHQSYHSTDLCCSLQHWKGARGSSAAKYYLSALVCPAEFSGAVPLSM